MSHVYPSVAVMPTEYFKQNSNKTHFYAFGTQVKECWNNSVKNSQGDYEMNIYDIWNKPVKVPDPSGSACNALGGVRKEVSSKYPLTAEGYDCILVVDYRTYTPSAGCAYIGTAGDDDEDGDGEFYNIAFVGESDSSGLNAQEVGHVFNARHDDHELWGWAEYTAMGNDGDTQCSGGSTPSWKYRRNIYHDCSCNNCTVNTIRTYCDNHDI